VQSTHEKYHGKTIFPLHPPILKSLNQRRSRSVWL